MHHHNPDPHDPDPLEQEPVGALRANPGASTPRPLTRALALGAAGLPTLDPHPSVLTVLSLFAGIGGLDLGLERAGLRTVGQVEIDPFCRRVLARHWPEVPRHDDVRTAPAWWTGAPRPRVDVVAGGFPCQPFSTAGRRRGVADERWGWPWMAGVVRLVRPRYVLVENVPGLLRDRDAFGWVLADLATLGFDARWGVLSACALGAPHTRERLFLLAYPHRVRWAPGVGASGRVAGTGPPPRPGSVA